MARYEEWIKRANSSLELAQAKISNKIYFEDLCYQAQQSVEKVLKGLLLDLFDNPLFTPVFKINNTAD